MPKLIHMITDQPGGTRFFQQDQLVFLAENGWDVTVISSPGFCLDSLSQETNITVIPIKMARHMSPLRDIFSLLQILATINRVKPDVVSAGTPKAGLLGMIAAKLLRVPARVYFLRGLRLETAHGVQRGILYAIETLTAHCAQEVICVSHSLRARFIELGLAGPEKTSVLANGSSNGINSTTYEPSLARKIAANQIRKCLNIPDNAFVIGFVGRLSKDKGGTDLIECYRHVKSKCPRAHLLIVGDIDQKTFFSAKDRALISSDGTIHVTGFLPDVAPYYHAMDVLVLPSYREGFPRAPLEAAASAVPTVAYKVTGTIDAVIHGVTGLLANPGDIDGLCTNIISYISDSDQRQSHGANARRRAVSDFNEHQVWAALNNKYSSLLTNCKQQAKKS